MFDLVDEVQKGGRELERVRGHFLIRGWQFVGRFVPVVFDTCDPWLHWFTDVVLGHEVVDVLNEMFVWFVALIDGDVHQELPTQQNSRRECLDLKAFPGLGVCVSNFVWKSLDSSSKKRPRNHDPPFLTEPRPQWVHTANVTRPPGSIEGVLVARQTVNAATTVGATDPARVAGVLVPRIHYRVSADDVCDPAEHRGHPIRSPRSFIEPTGKLIKELKEALEAALRVALKKKPMGS